MRTLLISYDLSEPVQNYTGLIDAIKGICYQWAKPLYSVWLLRTDRTPADVRDLLSQYIDGNDKLLVVECGDSAAWRNLSDDVSAWLKRELA